MPSEVVGVRRENEQFWREFPDMADYFSPAILPLLKFAGMSSKEVMHKLGETVGRAFAKKLSSLSPGQLLDELSRLWDKHGVGSLSVEARNPLVLQVSNCTVCGQLPGTGEMHECAFHEGFFQGALSTQTGKQVTLRQETNYEGDAGTWCRRLAADVSV